MRNLLQRLAVSGVLSGVELITAGCTSVRNANALPYCFTSITNVVITPDGYREVPPASLDALIPSHAATDSNGYDTLRTWCDSTACYDVSVMGHPDRAVEVILGVTGLSKARTYECLRGLLSLLRERGVTCCLAPQPRDGWFCACDPHPHRLAIAAMFFAAEQSWSAAIRLSEEQPIITVHNLEPPNLALQRTRYARH